MANVRVGFWVEAEKLDGPAQLYEAPVPAPVEFNDMVFPAQYGPPLPAVTVGLGLEVNEVVAVEVQPVASVTVMV